MTISQTPKLAIALSVLAGLAAPVIAQSNTTSKYMVLYTYHVKPAASDEFADFLKHKWVPAMKKGGASPRIYSSTPVGGDPAVFYIASYVDSLAMFDNPVTTLEKGAGAGPYARMQAQRAQMIEQRTNTILTRVPEMSVYRDSATESPLLLVTYVKTATGKQADYRKLWTEGLVPAVKKAGRSVSTWRVAFGEETQFVNSTPLASFAELDKGHTIGQLSMERAAYTTWNNAVQQTTVSIRREVLRLRRDLMGAE
jgi:hypothetical protein